MRRFFFSSSWDRGSIPTWFNHFYLSVEFVFIFGICISISTKTFMPVDIRHCHHWNKASYMYSITVATTIKSPFKYCAEKKADDKMLRGTH